MRPSIETLKTLEVAEITASLDPRPSKRARKEKSQPCGEIQGQAASPSLVARIGSAANKGKEKEKVRDDDIVSLYDEDGEDMMQLETGDGPMTRRDFTYGEEDIKIAEAAGIFDMYSWQVQSTSTRSPETNLQTELVDKYLAFCTNKICSICSGECKCESSKEWMLDSGASLHFTGDLNDYVEFTPMENGMTVMTATSSAQIMGKGTVILVLSTGGAV